MWNEEVETGRWLPYRIHQSVLWNQGVMREAVVWFPIWFVWINSLDMTTLVLREYYLVTNVIFCESPRHSKRSKAKLEMLLKAKSSHSFNLIDEFENQRCQILFNKLEWKEQMETKMLNRFEIKTTAVTCSKVSLFHTNSCRQSEKELQSWSVVFFHLRGYCVSSSAW